jgi:hypothetical protein
VSIVRNGRGVTLATLIAALALATVSGGFSITSMTAIFVGAYWPVIGMGVAIEIGKLSAVAWRTTTVAAGLPRRDVAQVRAIGRDGPFVVLATAGPDDDAPRGQIAHGLGAHAE